MLLHGGQAERGACFVGIAVSVALAGIGHGLPLLVVGLAFLAFAAYLAVAPREPGFR